MKFIPEYFILFDAIIHGDVLFIYFSWIIVITLQYCSRLCHTLIWISHGCTCVPHPEPPSHLPPHPIPQGHPSAPALSTLSHASNLDWQSVSYMIIYMFQFYSLRSSHPRLLPQSPKTVLYICVYFAVLHIELSLPSWECFKMFSGRYLPSFPQHYIQLYFVYVLGIAGKNGPWGQEIASIRY